jgi:CheY-like chemotaxis protein
VGNLVERLPLGRRVGAVEAGVDAEPLRVVVVDDDEPIRTLVRTLLDLSPLATVVADADGSPDAVAAACEQGPDVVLLDQKLGGRRGTELIGDIVRMCPNAMIAIFSALDAATEEAAALHAGAFAFYEKRITTPALGEIIAQDHALFRQALEGKDVCAPSAVQRRGDMCWADLGGAQQKLGDGRLP